MDFDSLFEGFDKLDLSALNKVDYDTEEDVESNKKCKYLPTLKKDDDSDEEIETINNFRLRTKFTSRTSDKSSDKSKSSICAGGAPSSKKEFNFWDDDSDLLELKISKSSTYPLCVWYFTNQVAYPYYDSSVKNKYKFDDNLNKIINNAYNNKLQYINYVHNSTNYILFFKSMLQISEDGKVRKVIKSEPLVL